MGHCSYSDRTQTGTLGHSSCLESLRGESKLMTLGNLICAGGGTGNGGGVGCAGGKVGCTPLCPRCSPPPHRCQCHPRCSSNSLESLIPTPPSMTLGNCNWIAPTRNPLHSSPSRPNQTCWTYGGGWGSYKSIISTSASSRSSPKKSPLLSSSKCSFCMIIRMLE